MQLTTVPTRAIARAEKATLANAPWLAFPARATTYGRMTNGSWASYDDESVMVAVQGGNRAALAVLYERHHGVLIAIGLKMLRSQAEAEDVMHNVFVEAWQRAGSYRPDRSTVRTWFCVRMRSRCLDRLKSAAVARSESLEPGFEPPSHYSAGRLPRLLDAQRAASEMDALPENQREVLELGYFKGYSSTEIADALEIPTGTVKSRVRAAMERLRERMEEPR